MIAKKPISRHPHWSQAAIHFKTAVFALKSLGRQARAYIILDMRKSDKLDERQTNLMDALMQNRFQLHLPTDNDP
jgi:hypothetical protein